jgi:hypothetical protein
MLWTVDGAGKIKPIRVRVGLSDGQKTQVQGEGLTTGTQVIVGSASGAQTASQGSQPSSPFQPQGGAMRRGPGGGF